MTPRLLPVLLLACLAACSVEQAPLLADSVVIKRPLPGVHMAAGYLTLRNTTSEDITINKVTSPQLKSVEMHESILDDGISRMYALPEIVIPPGGAVSFEAGGKHLMLQYPPEIPETVTLQFHSGTAMLLSIIVTTEE